MTLSKKFFIVGCQRSGTTLLRLILESHSKISCRDEPRCYETLSKPHELEETLLQEDKKWIGFKIPRFTEQLDASKIFDYGTPNISEPFPNFYEGDPIIFIVRDVRDVVCSMRELTADNIQWMKKWGVPTVKYNIQNSPEFCNQFSADIEKVTKLEFSDFSTGSFFWKYKNAAYFRYKKNGFPIFKIKYEDLVQKPAKILPHLLDFLDLEWEESVINHHTITHSEVDERGFAIGNTNSHKPIGTFHVGRYKNELTEKQIKEVSLISKDMMNSFGYEI